MDEKEKAWTRVADGIWRNKNRTLYERPKVNGKWTFRSLETSNLKLAREELHKRRSGQHSYDAKPGMLMTTGDVIRRYQKDDYPDQQRRDRPERMHTIESKNCLNLLAYWDNIPIEGVNVAECDRFHDWRLENIKRGKGHRAVDLDLNTLSNAFLWACRCELVKVNPLASRPKYCSDKDVKHCRETMPTDADDLHKLARLLFKSSRSEVLGWQSLVEAQTGMRTCEVLQLRSDAEPHTPGWITEDGKSMFTRRAKGQHAVNPFVTVHDGLRATIEALIQWKKAKHPESPWFFPSPENPMNPVGSDSLAHSLDRVSKELGHKVTSHGMRAFFVLVRRSNGISDPQIAYEIGHTTGGATIAAVYGGCPLNWLSGDGPKLSWLPSGEPAWMALTQSCNNDSRSASKYRRS